MMRIKVRHHGRGLHPRELVVSVDTREGQQQLALSEASVQGGSIEIGWPVGQDEDWYLVELPRETFSGFWRVWVPKTEVIRDEGALRATG